MSSINKVLLVETGALIVVPVTLIALWLLEGVPETDRLVVFAQTQQLQQQSNNNMESTVRIVLNDAYMLPLTNAEGNQLKVVVDYDIQNSSFIGKRMNAQMGVYNGVNGSLMKLSSFPNGFIVNNTKGTTQLATTLTDKSLENVTAIVAITDDKKIQKMSNDIQVNVALGSILPIGLDHTTTTSSVPSPFSQEEVPQQSLSDLSSLSSGIASGSSSSGEEDDDTEVDNDDDQDNDD